MKAMDIGMWVRWAVYRQIVMYYDPALLIPFAEWWCSNRGGKACIEDMCPPLREVIDFARQFVRHNAQDIARYVSRGALQNYLTWRDIPRLDYNGPLDYPY